MYVPRVKRQQITDDLRLFWAQNVTPLYKNGISKIANFLNTTVDDKDLPRFVTKNGSKFMINQKKIITQIKKLELKHQC